MKFLIVSFALVAAISAQYQGYKEAPVGLGREASARILSQNSEVNPDGAYAWNYETENGISASEKGALSAVGPNGEPGTVAEGGYQYTGPDGVIYAIRYVAGPGGYVAEGAHLPVAPPIPEAILRSLAFNAANPQKEDAYYKGADVTPKPYYPQPISSTPIPFVPQYKTPKPYYPSVRPTYQTPFQGVSQQPFGYTPQVYQAGRR